MATVRIVPARDELEHRQAVAGIAVHEEVISPPCQSCTWTWKIRPAAQDVII